MQNNSPYQPHKLNLTNSQVVSITKAKAKKAPITIRLNGTDLDNGNYTLYLTSTQTNQLNKAKAKGKGLLLTLSTTQIQYQDGEGLRETGQKIKNFFQNDVKNFVNDDVKNFMKGDVKNFFKGDVKDFLVDDVPGAFKSLKKNRNGGTLVNQTRRIAEQNGGALNSNVVDYTRRIAENAQRNRRIGGAIDPMTAMSAIGAIAPAIGNIAETTGKYANEQAIRGYNKNKITGKYARKFARNMRAMQRRAQKHFKRLQKLRDKGKMANLSDQQIWDMTRNTFAPNAEIQALEGPDIHQYDDDDDEDEDEYEDDTPEDDEEAVEFYGGIYGGGLFIHGRGFKTREFTHGQGFQTRDKKKSFRF
jgi:hypothetical protein